jgi:hypothetical protein
VKQGYANIFIFPCSRCLFPVVVAKCTAFKEPQSYFQGQVLDWTCQGCGHQERTLADNAEVFQSVEWNFEKHFANRKKST